MPKGLKITNLFYSIVVPLIGVFLVCFLLKATPVKAATGINQTINFQGRLLNNQGATVPDGFYNIEFKIYQDGDGQTAGDTTGSPAGSLKWTEDYLNNSHGVKVVNGYLSVQLGSLTPFGSNINWNQSVLWLSMQIGNTSACTITTSFQTDCGGDGEMTPMQPMTAAPYALNAGELGGLLSTQFVQLAQGVQTDTSSVSSIGINKTGGSGDILQLQKSGVDVLAIDNSGTALFRPASDSTTALQVQNRSSGYSVFTVDTSGNRVVLGSASNLTGKLAFATVGGGTLTISPTSSASSFTITFPGETGTVCTTAASGTCNTAGGLSNVAYLNQDQTFTGKNAFSHTGSTSGDYAVALTGTPAASSTSSLLRLGNTITGGNGALNGGTFISINESSSGAGSAADFLNLQNGSTVELQLTAGGNLTVNGTYDTNTFNNNTLGFGGNSAATISSSGSNNLTVDTGSSGGTLALGNNAATTNIGTNNAAHTIGIGTGAGGTTTQAITIGEATNSSSTLTLQGGNGGSAISLLTGNNGTTAGGIQIGNTSGAFGQTISIGTNNSAANIVQIGTGTSQDGVTIGNNTTATSSVTLNAGSTGGITLGANTLLTANSNLNFSAGTGKFDAHSSSGTFDTSTGTNSLNGNTTVTNTNTFTVNGGLTTLKAGLSVLPAAANAIGTIIQGAASQTAALLQLQDSTGAGLLTDDAAGNQEQLGYLNTPFGGVGNYGNLLLNSEDFSTTWSATNITVTANDGASNPGPDGNATADKLVSSASGTHTTTQTYASAGNNTYTFSVWLKTNGSSAPVQLRIDSNGTPATGTAASFTATTTWQRFSVTQSFTSGVSSVTPTIVMSNNNSTVVAWGGQLIQSSAAGVYVRTLGTTVAAAAGLVDNGTAIFQNSANSTTAFQVQNALAVNVAAVDTSGGQLVLGSAGSLNGKLAFATASGGTLTINPTSSASSFTITLPAETGTVCTTAASGACSVAGSGYVQLAPAGVQADGTNNNSIFINKTSGTGNILELQKAAADVFKVDNSGNVSSTGQNTLSRNGSGANDYTLGVTGTPSATGSSSLVRIGSALSGGNGAANGGTYLSIVEPGSGAGSAADFLNLQNGSTVELQLTSGGNLTVGGTYNGNTFDNAGHLTFGNSGAATISSNGSNNLTVDTGSSGGTETLGNNAATTNIGTSNAAHTVGIGTGGGGTTTQAITIGAATNSSSTLTLQGGNGASAILLQTGNNGTTAGGIQIGNTSGAFGQTISIGTNNAAANIVQIGTGTGQDSVTIGDSTTASSAVTIKAGSTGGVTLSASTTNINSATVATNQSTIAVFNSPTNVTEYQAGTSISIGATTGTLTVRNANTTLGNAAGSGTFTNNGATLYATDVLGDLAAGSIGSAASTVDVYTSFSIAPTASGRAYTINAPTASTSYGRTIYLSNIGTTGNYFTISGIRIPPGSTAALIWSNTSGGDSWQFAGAGGASIENQNTSDQTADFRINGTGRANTSFISPLFDAVSTINSGNLGIGTSTAVGITIGGTTNTTSVLLQGAASATYTLGTSNNTGGITVGNSTASNTISIGSAAGNGNTQTINIGTTSTSGSITNVVIGSGQGGTTTVKGATIFSANNYSSGSSSTITQSLIDNNTTVTAAATASGLTFTVPSPTTTTTGRLLYVSNTGSNAFIVNYGTGSFSLSVNSTVTLVWNGSNWTSAGADAGTLQTGYNNSTGGTTPELKVDSTRGGLDLQDADNPLNSSLFTVRNSNSGGLGAAIFDVQSANPVTDITNNTTNNLVTNGSFEVNVTGWAAKGSASAPAQNTTYRYIGNDSMKIVTTAAANDGTSYNVTLADSTAYSLVFSLRLDPSSSAFATLAAGYNNGSSDSNCTLNSTTVVSSGWTTYSCIFTSASSHSGTPYIYIKQTDTTIHTFYVDAVQLSRYSLLSNSSAEVAFTASDWQKKTGSETSVTQVSTQAQDGSNSVQVVTTGSAQGTKHNMTLNDNTLYSLTFYSKASGSNFSTLEAGYNDGSTNTVCITAQTVVTTGWTAYSCNFVTTASHSGTPYFYVDQTDATGRTFFLDNFQLAIGNPAGAYREGAISLNAVITSPVVLQGQTNSTTAFQVQAANGANILVVDSVNRQLKVMENAGSTNYALIYYDTASSTANYTASSGTVAVGTGAGAISVVSGSSAAITITANAASTWKTTAGTLTLQSGSSSDLILNPGSSIVSINGSSVVKLGSSAGDPGTCTTGGIVYNSTTNLFRGCQNGTWATLSSTTQTLQNTYTASTGGTTPEIKLDSTRGGVDIQDADSTIGGVLFAVRGTNAANLGTSLFNVSSANNTVNIGASGTSPALLVLGSDTDATLVNGSSSNAATEVDGAMFYSSTSHSFVCGESSAWVSCLGGLRDSSTATSQITANTDTNFSGSGNQYTIPANDCVAGRVYRVTAYGSWTNGATATTGTLKWKFGATTISTLSTQTMATSNTNQWSLQGTVTCIDSTHIEAQGYWYWYLSNTTTAPTITQIFNTATLAQVASGSQLLTLSAAVSQTTNAPNITERQLLVEGLGP